MSIIKTVLALDTSHSFCSTSVIRSNVVLSEISQIKDKETSENVIKLVDKALLKANLDLQDLDSIAVGVGPGNFTGIRVGISVAKGLAFALNIKCFGITRFQTLITNDKPTLAIINIRENLFYSQMFIKEKPISNPIEETLSNIINRKYRKDTIISGDNAFMISKKLRLKCGKKNSIFKASQIGFISLKYSKLNELLPSPVYVKEPDAKLPKEPPPKIL